MLTQKTDIAKIGNPQVLSIMQGIKEIIVPAGPYALTGAEIIASNLLFNLIYF